MFVISIPFSFWPGIRSGAGDPRISATFDEPLTPSFSPRDQPLTTIDFCINTPPHDEEWAGDHKGKSLALQDPLILEADLLRSVLAFEN
jgi:hypothetical protein